MKKMRAIILAAGVGSRISRHVDKPKSLLEIEGVPLLLRTVRMLQANNVAPMVVAGYEHEQIENVLKDTGVGVRVNPFYRVTNSLGSLWFARDYMSEDVDMLLMNADVFWEQDILDIMLSEDKDALLLADSSLARLEEGDYFFGCNGNKIVRYGKELTREIRTHEYVGVSHIKPSFMPVFRKQMYKMIEAGQYDGWWENVLYALSGDHDIYVKDVAGHFWAEVDYIEDYERIMNYVYAHRNERRGERK